MDEVIECPKCGNGEWIVGSGGTRCKCGFWLSHDGVIYESFSDWLVYATEMEGHGI